MSKHSSTIRPLKDCTRTHMDQCSLLTLQASVRTHAHTLGSLSEPLSFDTAVSYHPHTRPRIPLPGSPETITASVNKSATHQLAYYNVVTPETDPQCCNRLCESDTLKDRERDRREKIPLRVLSLSGLRLFQVIHHPLQCSSLDVFECGLIITTGP